MQYGLTVLGGVLFVSWFVAKASTQESAREHDLRAALSFTECRLSEYEHMVGRLGSLALQADVSFINFGNEPVTITDLVIFVETVNNKHLVRWEPAEYVHRSVSGESRSWGLPQVTVSPAEAVRRRIDFGTLEVSSADRETLMNKLILVGVEYRFCSSRGEPQIQREPVLSIRGNAVTRAPTISRMLGDAQ
jgi:hypothetical protein